MDWQRHFYSIGCRLVTTLLIALAVTPAYAQQGSDGIVSDWSDRHVVFSNPGTFQDAVMNGNIEEWVRIVTDPRYRLQQIKRHSASAQPAIDSEPSLPESHEVGPSLPAAERARSRSRLRGDWTVNIGSGNRGVAIDQYAAKYSFSPVGAPDCTQDFVVFEYDGAGNSTNQADLVGVNNLYKTTCTGTVPTVLFAYFIGTGFIETSPVLSLDGTKVAFVESINNGSVFHVLKLDKSGNSGCPSSTPCNGTAFNSPATPGTLNSAVDSKITMSGGVSVTRSSPFVDYSSDSAYVGDDTGKVHKFTGVFKGTPAEAGSPWPFTVASGIILSDPIFDSGASRNIFVGGSNGLLYCVTSAGAACATASITVGTAPILDAPIVDSTAQTVFAASNNSTNAILTQVTTTLSSQVNATMGKNGTDLFNGAFDSAYFSNIANGHMYFCGNLTSAATPALWRVTFNSSGTMSSTNDGNSFQLVVTGGTGSANDCTPLTEIFNSSQGKDFLFVGLEDHGFNTGTPNCNNATCITSFVLPTSSPFTFPTVANATLTTNLGNHGMSGFIIDNVSGVAGASQIYFGNLQNSTGVQASQSALQ